MSVRIVPWDLILSQFLTIKSLKLLTMYEPKSTSRTLMVVILRLLANRDMECLYVSMISVIASRLSRVFFKVVAHSPQHFHQD